MDVVLIGAGGHAKAIVEALGAQGHRLVGYVDPKPADWLSVSRICEDDPVRVRNLGQAVVMGLGAVTAKQLAGRLTLLDRYSAAELKTPSAVHPAAHVSPTARLGAGAIVLAGAVVQPNAEIGVGVIVNSGAIVEHDTKIGAGSHVAPGAIVLGNCCIGRCCMVGAGAVLLPESELADQASVSALSRGKAA